MERFAGYRHAWRIRDLCSVAFGISLLGFAAIPLDLLWRSIREEAKPAGWMVEGKRFTIESKMLPYWGGDYRRLMRTLDDINGANTREFPLLSTACGSGRGAASPILSQKVSK